MSNRADLWKLADGIQMDLRNAQGKLVEFRSQLAGLNIEQTKAAAHLCPECKAEGVTHDLRSTTKLAEHRYHAHGGPLPEHYAAAEALAVDQPVADEIERLDALAETVETESGWRP